MKKKLNNGIFYVVISFVAILAIGSMAVAYSGYGTPKVVVEGNYIESGAVTVVGDESLGASPSTDVYQPITFHAGFGGAVWATTSPQTTYTILESDLENYSVFEMTPTVAAFTWTLPATTTLATLLKNEGDTRRWVFINATTTTGATFTLAKGVGWDLTGVDANVDVIAGAAAGSYVNMAVDCTKGKKTTERFDITCQLTENIAVD